MEPLNTSPHLPDAELVHQSLRGNGEAFRTIVARYQALICSITYSGTGRICRSEEIAQETFVTAWQCLRELREPARLRAWLCGIARNLLRNNGRRAAHDPVETAAPLDTAEKRPAPDCAVPEQAMRAEEEAMLWRALARIPDTYREPLVLYYRQHRSVEEVAAALELTTDATKQRLSRGRVLLEAEVMRFVTGALEETGPRATFTHSVMSALPLLGASLSTSSGVGAAKAASPASAGWFAAMVGGCAALGGHIGWQMSPRPNQSEAEWLWARRFWRCAVLVLAAVILPVLLAAMIAPPTSAWALRALSWYLVVGYAILAAPFGIWAWENHRRIRAVAHGRTTRIARQLLVAGLAFTAVAVVGTARQRFPNGSWTDVWLTLVFALAAMSFAVAGWELIPRSNRGRSRPDTAFGGILGWAAIATVSMAVILVLAMGGRAERVPPRTIRELIEANPHAQIAVSEYQRGSRTITVTLDVNGTAKRYFAAVDHAVLDLLNRRGAAYVTRREGIDFETLGSPGRTLFMLAIIIVSAGLVIALQGRTKRPARVTPQLTPTA